MVFKLPSEFRPNFIFKNSKFHIILGPYIFKCDIHQHLVMVSIYQKSEYRISLRSLVQKNALAVFTAGSINNCYKLNTTIFVNLPSCLHQQILIEKLISFFLLSGINYSHLKINQKMMMYRIIHFRDGEGLRSNIHLLLAV